MSIDSSEVSEQDEISEGDDARPRPPGFLPELWELSPLPGWPPGSIFILTSDLVLDVPFYKIGIDADKQRAVGMLDHPEGAQAVSVP